MCRSVCLLFSDSIFFSKLFCLVGFLVEGLGEIGIFLFLNGLRLVVAYRSSRRSLSSLFSCYFFLICKKKLFSFLTLALTLFLVSFVSARILSITLSLSRSLRFLALKLSCIPLGISFSLSLFCPIRIVSYFIICIWIYSLLSLPGLLNILVILSRNGLITVVECYESCGYRCSVLLSFLISFICGDRSLILFILLIIYRIFIILGIFLVLVGFFLLGLGIGFRIAVDNLILGFLLGLLILSLLCLSCRLFSRLCFLGCLFFSLDRCKKLSSFSTLFSLFGFLSFLLSFLSSLSFGTVSLSHSEKLLCLGAFVSLSSLLIRLLGIFSLLGCFLPGGFLCGLTIIGCGRLGICLGNVVSNYVGNNRLLVLSLFSLLRSLFCLSFSLFGCLLFLYSLLFSLSYCEKLVCLSAFFSLFSSLFFLSLLSFSLSSRKKLFLLGSSFSLSSLLIKLLLLGFSVGVSFLCGFIRFLNLGGLLSGFYIRLGIVIDSFFSLVLRLSLFSLFSFLFCLSLSLLGCSFFLSLLFFSLSRIVKLGINVLICRICRLFLCSLLIIVICYLKDNFLVDRIGIGLVDIRFSTLVVLLSLLSRLFSILLSLSFCLIRRSYSKKLGCRSLSFCLIGFLFSLSNSEKLFLLLFLSRLGILLIKLFLIASGVKDGVILVGILFLGV